MHQIAQLLRKGESETLEFKESFGRETVETVSAFANTKGGVLLVGVNDDGVVVGVYSTKSARKSWADQISQMTGGLHPSIEAAAVKNRNVVLIKTAPSRIKPVLCHGRAFIRSGSTTRQMSIEEITRCVLANGGGTWDELPEPRAGLSDISIPKVRVFMDAVKREKRRPIPAGTTPVELLEKLGLVAKSRPTRAAVLLFGKMPQRFYSQARLKIGRFRGETLIVDERRFDGTLFEQVEGAMGYFREKLDTRFEMTGRPQRDVIWEYPLKALREAVINAVCHRDYITAQDTEVRIYDNELLVWNAGGLPPALSVEALLEKHASVPRNKQIAEILYYAGVIEAWGGGTRLIVDECAAAGLPAPAFEQIQGFRVAFRKTNVPAGAGHPPSTHQVPTKYPPSIPLSAGQFRLVEFCSRPRTIKEMLVFMRLKERRSFVLRYLRPLVKSGRIVMTDPASPHNPRQRYVAARGTRAAG